MTPLQFRGTGPDKATITTAVLARCRTIIEAIVYQKRPGTLRQTCVLSTCTYVYIFKLALVLTRLRRCRSLRLPPTRWVMAAKSPRPHPSHNLCHCPPSRMIFSLFSLWRCSRQAGNSKTISSGSVSNKFSPCRYEIVNAADRVLVTPCPLSCCLPYISIAVQLQHDESRGYL